MSGNWAEIKTPIPNRPIVKALVIIPTYNEANNISAIVQKTLRLDDNFSVLVVDDGSPDGTGDIVEDLQESHGDRLFLIRREGKQGLGTAYIRGFKFALERDFDVVCEMDADFSHNPDDLPRLLQAVKDGADLAIGSRYLNGVRVVNWPLSRLILSYGASIYARIITRMPVKDVTAGFKCFRRSVLEGIELDKVRSNGYSFQVEMNYRAWKAGYSIVEIPIVFTERIQGTSKMTRTIVREAAFKVWELRIRAIFNRL